MKKLLLIALLLVTFSSYSNAQVKTTPTPQKYGYVEVSLLGGMVTPMGTFGDSYLASPRAGVDLGFRVNKEVTIYTSITYAPLRSNNDAPSTSMIAVVVGPRYIFTNPKLSSNVFAEGGVGAFFRNTPSYTTTGTVPGTVQSVSETNVGFNAGLGGMLTVSKKVDIFIRTKYNMIFQEGGTTAFVGTDAGFTLKF